MNNEDKILELLAEVLQKQDKQEVILGKVVAKQDKQEAILGKVVAKQDTLISVVARQNTALQNLARDVRDLKTYGRAKKTGGRIGTIYRQKVGRGSFVSSCWVALPPPQTGSIDCKEPHPPKNQTNYLAPSSFRTIW